MSQEHSVFKKSIAGLMMYIAAAMSCFHLFTSSFGALPTMEQRSIHLCFVLVLIFLKCIVKREGQPTFKDYVDFGLAVIGLICTLYVYFFMGSNVHEGAFS